MRNYAFGKLYRAAAVCMCIAGALSFCSGCRRASAANDGAFATPRMPAGMYTSTPEITPEPTPLPTEYVGVEGFDPEAAQAFAADELKTMLSFDIGMEFDRQKPFADEIAARRDELLLLDGGFYDSIRDALRAAAARTAEVFGIDIASTELQGGKPGWQLVSAAAWACGSDKAEKLLKSGCSVGMEYSEGKLTAKVEFADIDDLLASASPEERFTACFVYSYFLTVFDDDFETAEHKQPLLPPDYIATLGLPLKNMYYYDSWYGPRQYSTRYHLGMDIHAAPDAEIFSCTDGEVKAIGFDDIAGYYVVVTDPSGYEYHYYHMIRQTEGLAVGDAVLRGQFIGSVGSTGNSDGYHLHLSIITPEHVHLNPYSVMCAVRDRKN